MQDVSFHRETCRLCDSRRVELVVAIPPIPLAEKYVTREQLGEAQPLYPVDLYQCLDCGHVQILDVIDPAVLWKDYTYHSGQTAAIIAHFQEFAAEVVERYHPPAGALVVDIGSNDGTLLKAFKERGLQVLGVDPAEQIAARATSEGIETLPSLFTQDVAARIASTRGRASVISAFNVFAHTDDMADMIEGVRELLSDDGVFFFEAQYLLDIIDRTLVGTIFHEHMCHHSVRPLVGFLERHGLELVDVRRVKIQDGSIIGTVQHRGAGRSVQASVAEMLRLEAERGLETPAAMAGFAAKLKALSSELGRKLSGWRSEGKTVAGYGAARSGPTLIRALGLEGFLDYVFDDHPQKVGKFTPGQHLEVVPTAELSVRRPDYVVILAFLHARKIIAKHAEFLENGGHFVLCCPEVEVIGA